MPDTIEIRSAAVSDAQFLYDLLRELGYDPCAESDFRTQLEDFLSTGSPTLVVALIGDEVVGFATASRKKLLRLGASASELDELAVSMRHRGRGVGRALLREVEARERASGSVRLILSTRRIRESYKRGFYAKNGFSEAPSALFVKELL